MFYIDAPIAPNLDPDLNPNEDEDEEQGLLSEIDFERDLEGDSGSGSGSSDNDEADEEEDHSEPARSTPSWLTPSSSSSKKPLWNDPSTPQIHLNLSSAPTSRLRKLTRNLPPGENTTVDGEALENQLRNQFERIHPEPLWSVQSKSDRKALKSNSSTSKSAGSTTDPLQALFNSTAPFIQPTSSRGPLPKGSLEVRRLRDANYQNRVVWEGGNVKKKVKGSTTTTGAGEGGKGQQQAYVDTGMVDVKFHPKVGVLAAVGADRRLRLFNVSSQ